MRKTVNVSFEMLDGSEMKRGGFLIFLVHVGRYEGNDDGMVQS